MALEGSRKGASLFVFHSDLSTMERLHREVFLPLRAEGEKGGNTPRLPFWGSYIHETTLGLLLSLFSYISNPKDIPEETSKCLASLFRVGSVPSSLPLIYYSLCSYRHNGPGIFNEVCKRNYKTSFSL
ncbi:hypothetical protein [Acetomicrobium sp.]|uniref:hypothetical protein n=1 Tax=Acetomicrobium sp. TaxID=1872099 RepID=UPI002FCC2DBE